MTYTESSIPINPENGINDELNHTDMEAEGNMNVIYYEKVSPRLLYV